ncbi:hypothetical protein CAEBREN_31071, partial [Caenorhabditis brenneri]
VNAVFNPFETPAETFGVNAISTPKVGIASNLLFIACIFALLAPSIAWTNIKPMTFYDCHSPTGQALIHPPKPMECKIPKAETIRKGQVTMDILNQTLEETVAFKCRIEVYIQCTASTVWIPTYNTSFVRMEMPSRHECWEAAEDKHWKGMSLQKKSHTLFESEVEYNWPSKGISVNECAEARKFVLEKGSVEELNDGSLVLSMMKNRNDCKIEDESCESTQAIMVWKFERKKNMCDTIHIGTFSATIGDNILVVDDMENAFPIDSKFTPHHLERCFNNGTMSSNGVTFFTFIEDPPEEEPDQDVVTTTSTTPSTTNATVSTMKPIVFPMRRKRSKDAEVDMEKEELEGVSSIGSAAHVHYMKETYDHAENIRRNLTMDGLNHKLQFVKKQMSITNRNNFNRLVDALCHTRNRQLRIWRMFLDLDQQAAMRVLLHRDDIVATFKGRDVVQVSQCSKVVVNKINEDRKQGLLCTAKTAAMTVDNKIVYIQPGSIEVDHSTETTDCSWITNYIWQDEKGNWKESNQTRNVTKIEERGTLEYEERQLIFKAGDIYAGVKGSSFPLMLAVSFGASIRSLQYQHQREVLKAMSTRSGNLSELKGNTSGAGDIVEDIFDGTVDAAKGVVSWFLSPYFIWIGVAAASIGVLGVIGFFAVKFYFFKTVVKSVLPINAVQVDEEETKFINAVQEVNEVPYPVQPNYGWKPPPLFTYVPIALPFLVAANVGWL